MALDSRHVHLVSSLPPDQLMLQRARLAEELGRPYQFELELLSPDPGLKIEDLLGDRMTVVLSTPQGDRWFNGHVARFGQGGTLGRYTRYHATLRPFFWLLTRASDSRIYKKMTVPEIVKKVVGEFGFGQVEDKLQGTYTPREYTVQYRETYFSFLSRLMEEEGVYYYFAHEKDKHTMVLCDDRNSHKPVPKYEEIPFIDPEENAGAREENFGIWTLMQEVETAAFKVNDFDFETPRADLSAKLSKPLKHMHANLEQYDPVAHYVDALDAGGGGDSHAADRGQTFARLRLEEQQAPHDRANASGNVSGLFAGALFKLTGHPRADQNREALIVRAEYDMYQPGYDAGSSSRTDKTAAATADEPLYVTRVVTQPSKQPFRSPRDTERPVIPGPHTAIVVGSGEIATDKYGRVKVVFPWDHESADGIWVRVAQIWAGAGWGGLHVPRVGHEVIVEFLEGDPDHPIITGRVYNGSNAPPFGLPDGATKSGVLSRSSKGGSADTANEISLEDKKGDERVFIHAEKNMDTEVEHDQTLWVGHDRTKKVDNDQVEEIKGNKTIHVVKDHTESIDANMKLTVGKNESETIGGSRTIEVTGTHDETIHGQQGVTVDKDGAWSVGGNGTIAWAGQGAFSTGKKLSQDVGADMALSVADDLNAGVGKKFALNVSKATSITLGDEMTMSVTKDAQLSIEGASKVAITKELGIKAKEITIEAEKKITLKAGDATITLDDGKIEIKGSKIQVKSDGDLVMKGSKIGQN